MINTNLKIGLYADNTQRKSSKRTANSASISFTGSNAAAPGKVTQFFYNMAEKVGQSKLFKNPASTFKWLDFSGFNMTYPVVALYIFGIVLGARLFQARDKDERREVATRDFSGLVTIVFALPVLKMLSATGIKKMTGFVLSHNDKFAKMKSKIWNHVRPEKGVQVLGFGNLKEIYTNLGNYKEGLLSFCKLIKDCGGNLKKIFRLLDNETQESLNKIVKNAGMNELPHDNESVIKMLEKAPKGLRKSLEEKAAKFFQNEENPIYKTARRMKGLTEAFYILFVSAFLGWFLPWFNIRYTRAIYKNKPQENTTHPNPAIQPTVVLSNRKNPVILTEQQKKLFNSFIK